MKKILFLFLFIFSISGFSQSEIESMTLSSIKLGEDRVLTIKLPPSYGKDSKKKFPLLFLLDGDYLMDPFLGAISYGNYFEDFPEVIVVGINQNDNHEREDDCLVEKSTGLPIGKGNQFFDFIGMEVIPLLTKKYRIAPFKIIAGHDITAGFANFFLYKDEPIFDAYISMSPELPTMMEEQIPERLQLIKKPLFYYQSTCDGDVQLMQENIRHLDSQVKDIDKLTLNYKFDDFKDTSHYELVLRSVARSLYHVFSSYRPISTAEFLNKIAPMTENQTEYLINKYETVEKLFSIKMAYRYYDFKAIESGILNTGNYNELEKLASVAKKQYPKSMLSDYYLAVMNEKLGFLDKAKKSYKDAYQKDAIGDLTKDKVLDKVYEYKSE